MYYEKYMNKLFENSGWATDAAFKASRGCLSGYWNDRPKAGGVVLYSHNGELTVDGGDECRHVLVIGATGTGKSRLIIIPSLIYSLRAEEKRSFVVFDVKGELKAATEHIASENGYKILSIDFRDPMKGNSWNPFYRINQLKSTGKPEDSGKAIKLLEDIIASVFRDGDANSKTDPFWRTSCSDLFRGICHALWGAGKDLTIQAILEMTDSIPADKGDDDESMLFKLADQGESGQREEALDSRLLRRIKNMQTPSTPAARLLSGIRSASNQTRGNIMACFRGYLSPISAREDVLKMLSRPKTMDFSQMGLEPTVLYIAMPDDTTALGGLQGILLTQLMQELNECALRNNGCLPVRTELYLDELCNIKPAIPMLETSITIARSRGMRYIIAIQSYAQLYGVYGSASETIAANCSSWIALNISKDETFREKLSRLCGDNALGDPLITPSQLALLDYEQAIVIRERCAPYFSRLEDISDTLKRIQKQPRKAGSCTRGDSTASNLVRRKRA